MAQPSRTLLAIAFLAVACTKSPKPSSAADTQDRRDSQVQHAAHGDGHHADAGHAGAHAGGHTPGQPHQAAPAKHPHANDAQRFSDVDRWSRVFEDPKRDAWQKPTEVISALKLRPGMKVADIGAATGYFPVRIARTHPDVAVYGVDVAPAMVEYLGARAKREGLENLHAVQGAASDPKLPEPVDLILLVDTYHHVHDRTAYFTDVRQRYLRPDGRLAVVDFRMDATLGPSREHKLDPAVVVRELEAAGFRVSERHEFLPQQYFMVFSRTTR